MKKIILLSAAMFAFVSNAQVAKSDYLVVSGKIINAKSKSISFSAIGSGGEQKNIAIQKDGSFKDSIKMQLASKMQAYFLEDSKMLSLYGDKGTKIHFESDAKDFLNKMKFSLDFADYNNYLAKKDLVMGSDLGFKKDWYRLDQAAFESKTEALKNKLYATLSAFPKMDPAQVDSEKKYIESYVKRFSDKYNEENSFANKLAKGKMSPLFENYESVDGGKVSLSDFKGKYVFIDVWATWCIPCKLQMPHLEEIEKEFHGKNIVFISMSIDRQKDKEKWRKMVKDQKMSGVQILAPNDTNSEFIRAYNINSIPRFILIDPAGKIVDFDVVKPSQKEEIRAVLSVVK